MATAEQVNEFRRNTGALVQLARRDLQDFWLSLGGAAPAEAAGLLAEFMPDLVQTYGSTAAVLAADFYDQLRDLPPSAERFRAITAEPVSVEQAQGSARWAAAPLFGATPNPAQVLSNASGSVQRLVMQPARSTIAGSAYRDPVRTLWARVPSGRTTCAFCLMLASRGPVYASAEGAGSINNYHDVCDCIPTPVRSTDELPEGYNPDELYEQYASVHEAGMTSSETAAALRDAYDIK